MVRGTLRPSARSAAATFSPACEAVPFVDGFSGAFSNTCRDQNVYDTPMSGEGLKCSPASFKRKRTFPVISSLATGLTLAPNDIFAWLTVEVNVLTFAWGMPW